MHYKFYLLLLGAALCLSQLTSCQKDNTTPANLGPIDNSPNINSSLGNFYCTRYNSSGYSSSGQIINSSDTSDIVMQISLNDDTLRFGSAYIFIVDSTNQTSFNADVPVGGVNIPYNLRLDFYNNYDSVVLFYENLAWTTGAGAGGTTTFQGSRSQLLASTIPHAYLSDLEGTYTLNIHKKQYQTGLDTQYTANLFVSQPLYQLQIGTDSFNVESYHSQRTDHFYQVYNTINQQEHYKIYWKSDSLYFKSSLVSLVLYPQSSQSLDTVYYEFKGTKQ